MTHRSSVGPITAQVFKEATGREPQDDDLARCNCPKAGEVMHYTCGWCKLHARPEFECGCRIKGTLSSIGTWERL